MPGVEDQFSEWTEPENLLSGVDSANEMYNGRK
jgi:hypothetical protein